MCVSNKKKKLNKQIKYVLERREGAGVLADWWEALAAALIMEELSEGKLKAVAKHKVWKKLGSLITARKLS